MTTAAAARAAQARRHRRAVLRAHHPDVGGDPEEFIRQLEELALAARAEGEVVFVRRPRGLRRIAAWVAARRERRRHPRVH